MTQQIEGRLLNEWLFINHPTTPRLGPKRVGKIPINPESEIPKDIQEKYGGVNRLYPDVMLLLDKEILIIEAKIRADSKTTGQLEGYMKLFPETPEFTRYKDYKVRGMIVAASIPSYVADMAKDKNIEIAVYRPKWVDQFLL